VDPVPDPLLLSKSGSAGNRTRTSGSVATEAVTAAGTHSKSNSLRPSFATVY
jgi:hypothetical protein